MVDIRQVRQDPQAYKNNPELIRLRQQLFEYSLRIDKRIDKINRQLESTDRETTALYRALADISEKAKGILLKNTERALSIAKEYGDYEPFREGLLQAIATDDIITAKFNKKGVATIFIDMDKAAGSIDNYAQAVIWTRSHFSKGESNAFSASVFWYRNIYLPDRLGKPVYAKRKNKETGEIEKIDVTEKYLGKYHATIAARIARFAGGKPAPWWKLLEVGNAIIRMKSDRPGGVGLPYSPPTHFVLRTQREIQDILDTKYREFLRKELAPFEKRLAQLKLKKKQNIEDRAMIDSIIANAGKTRQEAALEKIRSRLRQRTTETDENYMKIETLINRLAAGERVEGKINIGRNTRIRVVQILNELNLEYRDLER